MIFLTLTRQLNYVSKGWKEMQFLHFFVVRRRGSFRTLLSSLWSLVSFLCNCIELGDGGLQWERKPALLRACAAGRSRTKLLHKGLNSMSWARSHGLPAAFKQDGLVLGEVGSWVPSSRSRERSSLLGFEKQQPCNLRLHWWKECNTPGLTALCHHMGRTLQRWVVIPWE